MKTRKPFSRPLMLRMYRVLIGCGPMDSWGLAAALWPHRMRWEYASDEVKTVGGKDHFGIPQQYAFRVCDVAQESYPHIYFVDRFGFEVGAKTAGDWLVACPMDVPEEIGKEI